MTIGDRIRKKREVAEISQTDLAKAIDVSKQTLYKYENNIITNIPSDKIERIAKILAISPVYLMGWDEEDPNIQNRDADLETIEKILSADGYALCCESYDDDYFYIKDSSGKTVAGLYDYELLPRYDHLKKKGTVTAKMLISTAFTLYPEEKDHIKKYRTLDPHGKEMVDFTLLKEWERSTAEARTEEKVVPMAVREDTNYINAAHAIDGATEEEIMHDEDIMNDENF